MILNAWETTHLGGIRFLSNLKASAQQMTKSAEQGDSLQEGKEASEKIHI